MQQCVISILIKKYIILFSKLQIFIFYSVPTYLESKKAINLWFLELSFVWFSSL